jgi:hypothetical protein
MCTYKGWLEQVYNPKKKWTYGDRIGPKRKKCRDKKKGRKGKRRRPPHF